MKVKIFGAGSIGNHLSNAARQLNWSVDLCDIDPKALARTKNEIYPQRYGKWDPAINLYKSDEVPKGGYDLIFIGTPPDHHIDLALAAIEEKPRAILVEKPVCKPDLGGADRLYRRAAELGVASFTGYDHVVGQAAVKAAEMLKHMDLGGLTTLDVEFREFWGGIFAAHPWLEGPWDTYLGFWERGGGASGEHSHAINLWQHFALEAGAGKVIEVQAMLDFVSDGKVNYDRLCLLNLRTEHGLVGRVVQDVVTSPPRKWARLQGRNGAIEWHCGLRPGVDAVYASQPGKEIAEHLVEKTRPQDFILELQHIEHVLSGQASKSPISLEHGLDTMLVVAAAHMSARAGRTVSIDYKAGYTPAALNLR